MLHTVAKLHYLAELSQVQIAKRLGVSAATVSRLLTRARAEGIVRIEVRDLASPAELADRLRRDLGLRRAAVIEAPPAGVLAALATPAGALLLDEGLTAGAVLAIGWGRAIRAVVEEGLPPIPGVLVVPATGGLQQQAAHFQINEFVRLAADATAGVPHFIHAPYLPSAAGRPALLADPAIHRGVALWDRIDVAVVGVGLPHALNAPEASVATASERTLVHAAGDVIRHYFDADGRLIDWEGAERLIAASPNQLRAARLSLGVAAGAAKAGAIIGAARAGLINGLATDLRTAEAVLDLLAQGGG
jgi:DNA-binding transcriptional regulator LsrR (DeoR family)